jgi:hypothetical protein
MVGMYSTSELHPNPLVAYFETELSVTAKHIFGVYSIQLLKSLADLMWCLL